jgi:hypothetical protein
MAVDQTTVQNPKSVIAGSVKMEISLNGGSSFTDLGVGDAFAYTENVTKLDQTPDNGQTPETLEGISEQTINVSGNLWEYDLQKLKNLRGGIDNFTSTAAGTISGANQVISSGDWAFDNAILIQGQNADGTAPTVNSLTGSTDGAGAADDYDLVKSGDQWFLVPLDGTNFTTESQDLTLDYDYTPSASEKFSSGGLSEQSRIWVRLTNRRPSTADASDAAVGGINEGDPIWRNTIYDYYYCTFDGGLATTFPAETATETVVKAPVSFLGKNDPSRSDGDKLWAITRNITLRS